MGGSHPPQPTGDPARGIARHSEDKSLFPTPEEKKPRIKPETGKLQDAFCADDCTAPAQWRQCSLWTLRISSYLVVAHWVFCVWRLWWWCLLWRFRVSFDDWTVWFLYYFGRWSVWNPFLFMVLTEGIIIILTNFIL